MPTSDPVEAGEGTIHLGLAKGDVLPPEPEDTPVPDEKSAPEKVEVPAAAAKAAAKAAERDYVVLLAVDDVPEGSASRWAELGVVKDCANRPAAITAAEENYGLQADARVHLVPSRFWKEITGKAAPPKPPEIRWQGV